MFLLHHNQKHPAVTSEDSSDELLQRTATELLNLEITPLVLQRFKVAEEDLDAMAERPKTWVEPAVLQIVGEQDLAAERLQGALEFHKSVTDQAAGHLNLLNDNTFRTPWLAAKFLSRTGPWPRHRPLLW